MIDRLEDGDRALLLQAGAKRTLNAGEYLVHEGGSSDAVFVVTEGLLKMSKTSSEGRVTFVGLRRPGTMAGELGVLAPAPRSSALLAIERSTVRSIAHNTFLGLLDDNPRLSRALLEDLSLRLRAASAQIHGLANANARTRTASRLLQLADDRAPASGGSSILVELPISQQELGEWAGLSRAAVAKALRELRDDGIIETSRLSFTIHDLAALRVAATS